MKNCLHELGLEHVREAFSWLLTDVGGACSLWPGGPGLYKNAHSTQYPQSKLVSSVPLWPLHQLLPQGSFLEPLPWLPSAMDVTCKLK